MSSSYYIVRCIYYVVVHYFLLDFLILCWSKLFILSIFMCYRNVCKYVINSLPTNVLIHKMQGFVNWFYTPIIGQFGFMEYTSFKYFPIIMKGRQLIYFYFKNKCYKYLLVVNLSECKDYINICICNKWTSRSPSLTEWQANYILTNNE